MSTLVGESYLSWELGSAQFGNEWEMSSRLFMQDDVPIFTGTGDLELGRGTKVADRILIDLSRDFRSLPANEWLLALGEMQAAWHPHPRMEKIAVEEDNRPEAAQHGWSCFRVLLSLLQSKSHRVHCGSLYTMTYSWTRYFFSSVWKGNQEGEK